MDKAEARDILSHEEQRLRQRSYSNLRELLGRPETETRNGRSGAAYQVETQAVWDDGVEGNLRVLISIDDGACALLRRSALTSSSRQMDPSSASNGGR